MTAMRTSTTKTLETTKTRAVIDFPSERNLARAIVEIEVKVRAIRLSNDDFVIASGDFIRRKRVTQTSDLQEYAPGRGGGG